MEAELRPLTLGEILDKTFRLYHQHFVLFVGLGLLAAALRLIFSISYIVLSRRLVAGHHATSLRVLALVGSSLSSVGSFFVTSLTFAAITFAVARVMLGEGTSIGDAFRAVGSKWKRFAGLNALTVLFAWAPTFAVALLLGLTVAFGARVQSVDSARTLSNLYEYGASLFLLTVPLGVWLSTRYSLGNAVAAIEQLPIRASLARSVQLSYGTRWRIIAAAVCILVIEVVFAFLFMIPLLGLVVHGKGHPSLLTTSLQLAVGFFASMLFTPLYGIVLTLFYFDARIRKEGYDVEWLLMRSAGTPAQAHL